jgi:hypothetical protein
MLRNACLALVIGLAFTRIASAQTNAVAQLTGSVTDESGAAIPGVEVSVTQTDTGFTRSIVSDERGQYLLPSLPVGPYKLVATLPGFTTFEQSGILLRVGDTRSVNVALKVGNVQEKIEVIADANLVETQGLSVGTVTSQEALVNLPLNGRQATQLLLLEGAIDVGGTAGNRGYPGQVGFSVAGGTGNSTQYLVDGGYNNDPQQNSGNILPFPDALQEFRTEAGVRDARYGMSVGATVNAVTKSGTNNFHGNVFYFMRDHRFNTIPFFNQTANGGTGVDDGLHRDQFGGTIGGPVKHDKLFFFGGIQATNNNVTPLTTDQFLPTAAMLQGDFTQVMSAACRGGTARTLGAPFVNNKVDPNLFNPLSLKILTMVPTVNPALDPNGCGRYPFAIPNNSKEQQYVSRADYQLSSNKRIFFRDFYAHYNHPAGYDQSHPNLLAAAGNGLGNRALSHTIASGLDWVVTPKLVSTTRFSYQHTFSIRYNGTGVPTLGMLGVKSFMYTTGAIPGQDMLEAGIFNSAFTGQFFVDTPQISQDIAWNKGEHSLSFGFSWTRPSSVGDGPFQADGQFTYNGLITSGTTQTSGGLNFADFLLGYPSNYKQGGSQINNEFVHAVGAYANDIWRVSKRVTVNYGVRWEPYLAPKDRNGFVTGFIRDNFDKGIRSTVYPNAPVGLVFKGDPGFPTNNTNQFNQYGQIAPRFGVVLDPQGDGKQTIRAGFGVYFDSPKLWTTAHHMLNAPFGNTVNAIAPTSCPGQPSKNGCAISFLDPWSSTPGGDPLAAINYQHMGQPVQLPPANVKFPVTGVYVSMPGNAHPMRSYQYNLSFQRQLTSTLLLDVTYIGNQQRHMWIAGYGENPAVYIPGNCTAGQYGLTAAGPCSNTTAANRQARAILTLLNPTEGNMYNVNTGGQTGISQAYMDAEGHYNGLKFSVQKRMSKGWSESANYTYSKCVNQGEPSTDIGWSMVGGLKDPYKDPHPDPSLSVGPCAADRPHILNMNTILLSPGVGNRIVKLFTKDWQAGLIVQMRSGSALTPGVTNDNALTGEPNQKPLVVSGVNPYLSSPVWVNNHTQLQWIDMTAFANPAAGQHGNVANGMLRGPGFWNADLAFSRIISLAEARRFELRIEAFNLLNNVNWSNPNVTVDNANAGRISSVANEPRIMQFAIKYAF